MNVKEARNTNGARLWHDANAYSSTNIHL